MMLIPRRHSKQFVYTIRRSVACLAVLVVALLWVVMLGMETGWKKVTVKAVDAGEYIQYSAVVVPGGCGEWVVCETVLYDLPETHVMGGSRGYGVSLDPGTVSVTSMNLARMLYTTEPGEKNGGTSVMWHGVHIPGPTTLSFNISYTIPKTAHPLLNGQDPTQLPDVVLPGYNSYTVRLPLVVPLRARSYEVKIDWGTGEDTEWAGDHVGDTPLLLTKPLQFPPGVVQCAAEWKDVVDFTTTPHQPHDTLIVKETSSRDVLLPVPFTLFVVMLVAGCLPLLFLSLRYRAELGLTRGIAEELARQTRAVIFIQSFFRGWKIRKRLREENKLSQHGLV